MVSGAGLIPDTINMILAIAPSTFSATPQPSFPVKCRTWMVFLLKSTGSGLNIVPLIEKLKAQRL